MLDHSMDEELERRLGAGIDREFAVAELNRSRPDAAVPAVWPGSTSGCARSPAMTRSAVPRRRVSRLSGEPFKATLIERGRPARRFRCDRRSRSCLTLVNC